MLADITEVIQEFELEQKATIICDMEQEFDLSQDQELCRDATAENQLSTVRAWFEDYSDAERSIDQTRFVQTPMEYLE